MRLGGREEARRPFWLHQAAEYLFGLILVAQGLQSPTPTIPALAGGLVILNAAIVDGPIGAFRAVSRRQHRWCDVVVMVALVAGAALPFLDVDNTSRLLMIGIAVVMGVMWWNTAFEPKAATVRQGSRTEAAAGYAGRFVGNATRAVRQRRRD